MKNRVKELIKSKVSLAPMAGITDFMMRDLIRNYTTESLLTTEMISSEFLYQVKGNIIEKKNEKSSPVSYQISGHKPQMMAEAAKYLNQFADMIDINMGCPVNKVVKGQDGSALMRNPELATEIVKAVKEVITVPLSVKFRLGYTFEELNYVEYGQQMQEAGADFITIHGRTRSQMYSGKADWAKIKVLKDNVDIPVFANGDVVSIETAEECMNISGADGVAIGRGALGDLSLIARVEHYFKTGEKLPPPTIEERIEQARAHLNYEIEMRGENVGIKFMRKFYPYYISKIHQATKLRAKLMVSEDIKEIYNILDTIKAKKEPV